MKLFSYGKDGGKDSTVSGFWFIEAKKLFSVAILKFSNGSREAYHNHAFNSISWLLYGNLIEDRIFDDGMRGCVKHYYPSFKPIITTRDNLHKVASVKTSIVLTFRGPWLNSWSEWFPKENKFVQLTHGRKVIDAT